ncbi:lipopolysaccharide biosynthesis protein [Halogeometricum borinquense]|uniref:Lipopolysaccharide biosynthesis protein n=1 Tax=Halogeometricum borinquense TaxID=60847 RepID=A0A6C0UES9_9EURY|nr:lipopolysaccharide biosynthesis protein [Halogeometricum borinquense]QIB73944.1 lipopolysaccharide biosynthesis protein [Halogeometricum borinquense]
MSRLRALLRRLVPSGGTAERVVKSAIWAMGQNAFGRILQLAMLVVLARLIGPTQIGLVGVALLALSGIKKFTNVGLDAALVQDENEDVDEHLNTVWILEIARGAIISGLLVLAAPFIAQILGDGNIQSTTTLIQVIALSPLLLGFKNPGMVYFQKNLDFHKRFVYRVSGDMVQVVVAIAWALVSPTAMSLVAGYVAADFLRLVLSYLLHDFRPNLSFSRESANELINYGKWITGSSILYFLYSEGDDAFVGAFIGAAPLAFYQYAYRFSNAPATELTSVISSVMFPAFSKLQDDTEQLRNTFKKTLRVNAFISAPVAFGIAVVAPDFVMVALGEEWMTMVLPMQILAIYGFLRALGQTFGPIWKALGRPDLLTKLGTLRVILIAVTIYPVTVTWGYGIAGTAAVVTAIYVFPMMPIDIYLTAKMLEIHPFVTVREIGFPVLASAIMAGVVWYVNSIVQLPAIAELVIGIVVGAATYFMVVALLERQFHWGIGQNIQGIVANARR